MIKRLVSIFIAITIITGFVSSVITLTPHALRFLQYFFSEHTLSTSSTEKVFDIFSLIALSGWFGAIMGAGGHMLGIHMEKLFMEQEMFLKRYSKRKYFSRFWNDFFRTSFWTFGILTSLFINQLFTNTPIQATKLLINIIGWSFIVGVINGSISPLLNKYFFDDYSGESQIFEGSASGAIKWFSSAGAIFGALVCFSFWVVKVGNVSIYDILPSILLSSICCAIYGVLLGFETYRIKGFGRKNLGEHAHTLNGFIIGSILAIPIAIICFLIKFGSENISPFFVILLVLINILVLIGVCVPDRLLKKFDLLNKVNNENFLSKIHVLNKIEIWINSYLEESNNNNKTEDKNDLQVIAAKVTFMYLTGIPWGALIAWQLVDF
jgi:hypothetical protein